MNKTVQLIDAYVSIFVHFIFHLDILNIFTEQIWGLVKFKIFLTDPRKCNHKITITQLISDNE